jgi:hypothetical protein
MARTLPYREGDVFAVPLEGDGGYQEAGGDYP